MRAAAATGPLAFLLTAAGFLSECGFSHLHQRPAIMSPSPSSKPTRTIPSQTLFRGLEIIDAVANGVTTLPAISEKTGINSSTAHRLASALVQIRYLKFEPRKGYSLGSKLIELGFLAYQQSNLPATARASSGKAGDGNAGYGASGRVR